MSNIPLDVKSKRCAGLAPRRPSCHGFDRDDYGAPRGCSVRVAPRFIYRSAESSPSIAMRFSISRAFARLRAADDISRQDASALISRRIRLLWVVSRDSKDA